MKVHLVAEPWPHLEIENFLSHEEYIILKQYCDHKFSNLGQERTHKFILGYQNKDQLVNADLAIWNYCYNIAQFKFPILCENLLIDPIDYNFMVEFSCFNQPCPRGIHVDMKTKYLSCLVYMNSNGNGTHLYHTHDNSGHTLIKTVDNRKNKALAFQSSDEYPHAVADNQSGDYRTAVNLIYLRKDLQ